MDIPNMQRLKQIRDMQLAKLEELQKTGASKDRIENMKFALKCTERRIEYAAMAEQERAGTINQK